MTEEYYWRLAQVHIRDYGYDQQLFRQECLSQLDTTVLSELLQYSHETEHKIHNALASVGITGDDHYLDMVSGIIATGPNFCRAVIAYPAMLLEGVRPLMTWIDSHQGFMTYPLRFELETRIPYISLST